MDYSTLVMIAVGIVGAVVGILGAALALTRTLRHEDDRRRADLAAMEGRINDSRKSDWADMKSDLAAMEKRIMDNADRAHAEIARNIQGLTQRFDRHLESHPGQEEG